jgi:nicotinamidase-related amidase
MADPTRQALVIIECQRGIIGDLSALPALAAEAAPTLAAIGRLAAGARDAGVVVAHLTYMAAASGRATNRRSPLMRSMVASGEWTADHPASQVVDEIGVGPDDLVLPRHQGISPVHRTETLAILRNMGVEEIVVAGVSTNLAVPLVAVAAIDEDFDVLIPVDAVAGTPQEHHESMLRNALALVGRLTSVDDLLASWRPPL